MAAAPLPAALRRPAAAVFAYFTRHPTAANLLMVLMLAAGLVAAPQMRAQFFPDVVAANVVVTVPWPGAGAGDLDEAVVSVLDPVLLAVEGVSGSTAVSREGRATITLDFEPGIDLARAAAEVEAAVDAAGPLPEGTGDLRVRRSGWSDRVIEMVIAGPVAPEQLARLADEYAARLFAAGVTRSSTRGIAAPRITVELGTAAMMRHGIGMAEVAAAIAAAAEADPAGDVAGGSARVRSGTPARSAEAIAAVVLRLGPDGSALTVGDVATVTPGAVDRNSALFVGGDPAVAVRVNRGPEGDALAIQAIALREAERMAPTLPAGVTIAPIRAQAEAISDRLRLLLTNGAMGLGLVVVLLFLFLNARTALWVAAGIPVAMSAAIAAMYAMGLSFNMISLFALIITLGLVVDDAIVVGEHADARARELGEAPAEAAERAATRMAQPVFAASITTVIAFAGLMAVGGRFGEMVVQIPLTVIAVLLASLVECFLILPHHMRHALAAQARAAWYDWPSRQVTRGFRWLRERGFRPLMRLAVRGRYPVIAAMVLLLALQAAALIRGDVGWRFFTGPDQGRVTGNFAMLPGASRADTAAMLTELQRAVAEAAEGLSTDDGRPPLVHVLAELGAAAGRGLIGAEDRESELIGSITIELAELDRRDWTSAEFVARLQEAVVPHPQLEMLSFRRQTAGPGGDALSVRLVGADNDTLKSAAEALKLDLARFPEVSGLEDSLGHDKPELSLALTPQGHALGFTVEALGRSLRDRLTGIEAATFPEGPRTARIRVELPPGERGADFLDRTLLQAPSGAWVPLADIVTMESRAGFGTIRRENGLRVVSVTGAVSEDDPARAAEITRALAAEILPALAETHGIDWQLSGLAEEERAFLGDAMLGFTLCMLGIYLTLAWVFASWTRPMVVMAVIPFGLIGAVWGHAAWEMPLSMFSVVGLIGMSGIIINDSIVLVRSVDEEAERRGLHPAIVEGACSRLRPVLLTTLTTVLGLAPLLYERSSQAEFLKPTVITLTYGLGFGMLIVLLLVPALLAAGQDVTRARAALRRGLGRRAGRVALPLRAALAGIALAFGLTLGPLAVTGRAPGWLPVEGGPLALAGLFLAASMVVLAVAWLAAAWPRRRRDRGIPRA